MLLDEYAISERILNEKKIKERSEIFIVAKYLRHEMKCDELETFAMLNGIMACSIKKYDPIKSARYLENISTNAIKYGLKRIESINITQSELKSIQTVCNAKWQRLLFTLLVYAKFNNAISENNNDWCNIKINDLYKIAKVSTRNSREKALILNKLQEQKLISFSRRNTNLNIRCLFIDNVFDSNGINISDIRELGYQYINIKDKSQFSFCEKCGVIIKKNKKNDCGIKFCSLCLQTNKLEQKNNCFQKLD